MLLKSTNHFYIYESKSKYLFSLHPLIIAHHLAEDKQLPEMLQNSKSAYSSQDCEFVLSAISFYKNTFS